MWESTFLMTVTDLIVLCLALASLWVFYRNKTTLAQAGVTPGGLIIVLGLLTIGLFYLADLYIMYGLPLLTGPSVAHAAMENLHLNYSWYQTLLATAFISVGFVLATQKLHPITKRLYFTQFAVDQASECIYWLTPDARFFCVNAAACKALGYTRDDLLSMSVHDIDPDFPAEVWPDFWEKLRAHGSLTFHAHHRTKQNHVFPVEIRARCIQFEGRDCTCAVVRDITERRRVEEPPQVAVTTVERRVTEHTRGEETLQPLAAKQSEPVRKRDPQGWEVSASIAHELRTPLTCVKALFTALCNERVTQGSPAVREELIKGINQEIEHLSHEIDNLLDVSRIEGEGLRLNREWHLFEDLLEAALRYIRPHMRSGLLDLDIPYNLPLISVDKDDIQRVLINLLENAVKYSREGSPIAVRVTVEGKEVVVRVTSIGEVIPPEDLTRVFERFYRVSRQRTPPIRGIGLGLAICRRVVEAHGGKIWAQSTSDGATTFTFTLPLNERPASPKPPTAN